MKKVGFFEHFKDKVFGYDHRNIDKLRVLADSSQMEKLSERGKKHLWHPLTQHKTYTKMLAISRANGALLFSKGGNEYVDGIYQLRVIYALDLNVEMERYENLRDKLFKYFMGTGTFLRSLGNTIYMLAPFIASKGQMERIYKSIHKSLNFV